MLVQVFVLLAFSAQAPPPPLLGGEDPASLDAEEAPDAVTDASATPDEGEDDGAADPADAIELTTPPSPAAAEASPKQDKRGTQAESAERTREEESSEAGSENDVIDTEEDAEFRKDRLRPLDESRAERRRLEDKRERHQEQRAKAKRGGQGILPEDALDPLLVLPLQVALGFLVSTVAGALWPIAPIIVATLQVLLGDLLGPSRGAVLPSAVAAYLGMLGCGLAPLTVVGAVVALAYVAALLIPGAVMAFASLFAIFGLALLWPAAFAGIPAAHCGSSVASALTYRVLAEEKRPGDREFRFPGVLVPSHPEEESTWDASLAQPHRSLAMRF